ncbi:MAG: hypothetical protein IPM35_29120 [Myxococcales bacterium]|nr:hypothetical protein [Myxococcales bacterium]
MFRGGVVSAFLVAMAGTACGGEPPERGESPAAGGSSSLASGGAAGAAPAPSGGSGGRSTPSRLYASFVPAAEPGDGPALVWFQNDTEFSMSLWLGQAAFLAIPSGQTAGPQLAASAAVEADTTTGQHKENACVRLAIAKVIGPSELAPGLAYSMSVSLDETLGFVGTLVEEPTPPFVAVRAEVHDSTSDAFTPSRLQLTLSGGRAASTVRFVTYDDGRTTYQHAGPGELTAAVTFTAGNGDRFVGSEPVTVGGVSGYTVVVDRAPVDRSSAVVPLNKTME